MIGKKRLAASILKTSKKNVRFVADALDDNDGIFEPGENIELLVDCSNLSENLFNEIEFYLTEWHSALPELPSIEIVESEKSVSLLQPEKVFPMLLPVTYYYSDNTTLDSTIYTKSFKTVLADKLDSTVIKIEIDPQYHSLRSLNDTEIDSKLKDIFNYNYLQISISNAIMNPQKIVQLISTFFFCKGQHLYNYYYGENTNGAVAELCRRNPKR